MKPGSAEQKQTVAEKVSAGLGRSLGNCPIYVNRAEWRGCAANRSSDEDI